MIDNTEAVKSKKQKEKLEVKVVEEKDFAFKGTSYTGEDLAAHADAVAGARKAVGAIKKSVEASEDVLKAYMYHNWSEQYALQGRAPDMRELVGGASLMEVSQYTSAEVPSGRADALKKMGLDISGHAKEVKYKIKMGNVPKPMVADVLAAIRGVLGDEMYKNVVSQFFALEGSFFSNFREIVQASLSDSEKLSEKMEDAINLVKPTIQFLKPRSDLSETESYDLALEFAEIAKRGK